MHRHPKSIGCAYRLGFGGAEGKMRFDLSLTYGGGQRGGALHTNTLAFYLLSAVFTGQFVIAHMTDPSVSLFRTHLRVEAPVIKAEIKQWFVLLSVYLN